MKDYTVISIPKSEAIPWILQKHYAKRKPSISYAFGLYNKTLKGICTFGLPASPSLCVGICGEKYADIVIEFNRLCLLDNRPNEASYFIGKSIRLLPTPLILVSYADTGQNHIGYVYQAINWIYTGLNNESNRKNPRRYRKIIGSTKHCRHLSANDGVSVLIEMPLKHRYINFIGSKKQKKEMKAALRYPILPYPKGELKRYDSGGRVETQKRLFL